MQRSYKDQTTIDITPYDLIDRVYAMKEQGYRLVQVSCTRTTGYELYYSFDLDYVMVNLRLNIAESLEIQSISAIYPSAFLYENEMKDLFGVKVLHISPDYEGNLYKLAVKTPFKTKGTENGE